MQADLALFRLHELRFSGASDPIAALVLCLAAVYIVWGTSYVATRVGVVVSLLLARFVDSLRFMDSLMFGLKSHDPARLVWSMTG